MGIFGAGKYEKLNSQIARLAMRGSGVKTGKVITAVLRKQTLKAPLRARTVCFAAAVGSTSSGAAGCLPATLVPPIPAAASAAFACL